jgi:hypothetical protein
LPTREACRLRDDLKSKDTYVCSFALHLLSEEPLWDLGGQDLLCTSALRDFGSNLDAAGPHL